jgi:uncharacterized protein YbjQ (UPF0145 family)
MPASSSGGDDRDHIQPSSTAPQGEGGALAQEGTTKTPKKAHLKTGDTFKESAGVLVTTRGTIAGHRIVREVGIIVGSSVKSRHVGHDLWARVLGFFGSSIVPYAEMMVDSSAEATYNLMQEASKRGANAVLRVRYETAASSDPAVWSSTFSYTLAYGTAVVVKPAKRKQKDHQERRQQ